MNCGRFIAGWYWRRLPRGGRPREGVRCQVSMNQVGLLSCVPISKQIRMHLHSAASWLMLSLGINVQVVSPAWTVCCGFKRSVTVIKWDLYRYGKAATNCFHTNCSFIFVEISSLLAVESIHQLSICPHRLGGADINVLKSMVEAGNLGE